MQFQQHSIVLHLRRSLGSLSAASVEEIISQSIHSCHYYSRGDSTTDSSLPISTKASVIIFSRHKIRMNDSITSAEESPQPHNNLFQEINKINTDEWHDAFSPSPHASFHSSFDQEAEASFGNDLPLQSKICQDLLELQHVLEATHQEAQDNAQQKGEDAPSPSPSPGSVTIPSQVTITPHEQSAGSKFFEEDDTHDHSNFCSSLRSFLTLKQKNYRPHLSCLKFLFEKVKEHSRQSLGNLKAYIHFLEIKMKQEARSLKPLEGIVAEQQAEDDVGIDQKVLMQVMRREMMERTTKRMQFQASIKQIHQELLFTWRTMKEKRQKRERYIEEEIIRVIDRIELEMDDMIKCRLLSQSTHASLVSDKIRSHNPYLTKDKYLEMKYLIQRENAYLSLIGSLNAKLATYITAMFSNEELHLNKLIREALVDYSACYMACYATQDPILALKMEQAEDEAERRLKAELADMLLGFIPKELYDMQQHRHTLEKCTDRLEAILGGLGNCLQNTILMSSIQMDNEFILFRSSATWKTSSSLLHTDHCIDYESRQALATSNQPSRIHHTSQPPRTHNNITVVLTSNYYLHLEKEDKMATVQLGEVKLSKRGREVIIAEKGSGMGGLLGIKRELGRLEFDTAEEVDMFALKLSLALRKLAT